MRIFLEDRRQRKTLLPLFRRTPGCQYLPLNSTCTEVPEGSVNAIKASLTLSHSTCCWLPLHEPKNLEQNRANVCVDFFAEAAWQRFVKLFSYALDSVTPLFCMQDIWRIRFTRARTHVEPLVKWNTWRICIKLFRSRFVSFPLWRALEILIAAALSRSPIGQSGRGWNIARPLFFLSPLLLSLLSIFFSSPPPICSTCV